VIFWLNLWNQTDTGFRARISGRSAGLKAAYFRTKAMSDSDPEETYVRGATLRFGDNLIFENISLDLVIGGWTCLLGQSGVGKSSLLRLIAGLDHNATAIERKAAGITDGTQNTAYMAQQDLLMPWLTLAENVSIGARLRNEAKKGSLERACHLLDRVGLGDEAETYPDACSGGMRQRTALARTLFENRQVVLMDEPFSSVDSITRLDLQDLASEILFGKTVLLVTHDIQEALRLGDKVVVMKGRPANLEIISQLPEGSTPRAVDDAGMAVAQAEILRLIGGNSV
jgi:putative hydroxymethylpyrimidine transport system ATP-binding protein